MRTSNAIKAVLIGLVMQWAAAPVAHAQTFPPGTFSIDGIPVVCGSNFVVLNPYLPDAAMNNMAGVISVNPNIVGQLPTVLKLFTFAHECGHSMVGLNEIGADCWAVRTGKEQGWFPPESFQYLVQLFANNPGDLNHPPGPARVQAMWNCYNSY
ncbi:MAG: hypothetical protein NT015_01065 [Alphaproteobacteria bacterium]|nr:hypothetical protein [Alphaproteobacteria bacterium]